MNETFQQLMANQYVAPVMTTNAPEVTRLSIPFLVTLFAVAVAIHIAIGFIQKKCEKEILEKGPNDERLKNLKTSTLLFRWYPAIAVVVLILVLYS